ncbi:Coproporphyrinogen III oxidase, aerobic [Lunatimonas lonarensis]|uniref:coproporphyrinogen oxidase n=1 Tax=Lunatimonas lonarensis TaxID=1232681 RepID=R7ZPA9_9BACT|nr:oxygen-dependent coproporphyrinogen oxidase [Lunatimonas lonarensis]EON75951.1 Coproporphyrinogen III oxidase, aerobic [Lunatimonas lonarensis]
MTLDKHLISEDFKQIQSHICEQLEQADGVGSFIRDHWQRPEGGGGLTRVLNDGAVIAKGGVAFSAVHGPTPEKILKKLQLDTADFFATGVSIVIHPVSPMVPIIHMNIRYFEMSNGVYWFGGGIDLTPHYVVPEDAAFFHGQLKNLCDRFDPDYYPTFKAWADDYFFLKHRQETRGIGGIFFDRLTETASKTKEDLFSFVKEVGYLFPRIYTHYMRKNADIPYGEKELAWQALRRGRYVEFNLVWDAGTKFGLDTNGRTESILMSMPPQAKWEYNHQTTEGSAEQFTLKHLQKGIDWLNLSK